MLIRVIPETDAEKAKFKEEEHHKVGEFLLFGNRKDADGNWVDFQVWDGSHRYLQGSLHFFLNKITEEINNSSRAEKGTEIELKPSAQQALHVAQGVPVPQPKKVPFMKRGGDGTIDQVATAETMQEQLDGIQEHHLDRKHGLKVVKVVRVEKDNEKDDVIAVQAETIVDQAEERERGEEKEDQDDTSKGAED